MKMLPNSSSSSFVGFLEPEPIFLQVLVLLQLGYVLITDLQVPKMLLEYLALKSFK